MSLLLSSISDIISSRGDLSLLKVLYTYVKNGGSVSDPNQLGTIVKTSSASSAQFSPYPAINYGDWRLREIFLKGIRKFPTYDNRYYSIGFGGDGKCHSCVFLGCNGVGKSSFYSAIEWASLGKLDSAKNRGYTSFDEQTEYMRFHGAHPKECEIRLSCHDKDIAINLEQKAVEPIAFPAFFCMEHDITELSKKSYGEYIAEQLGLKNFYTLLNTFDTLLTSYETLKDSYAKASDAIAECDTIDILAVNLDRLEFSDLQKLLSATTRSGKQKRLRNSDNVKDKAGYLNTLVRKTRLLKKTFNGFFPEDPNIVNSINKIFFPFDDSFLNPVRYTDDLLWGVIEEGKTRQLEDCLSRVYTNLFKNVEIYMAFFPEDLTFTEVHDRLAKSKKQQESIIHDLEGKCTMLGASAEDISKFRECFSLLKSCYKSYIDRLVEIGQEVFDKLFKQFLGKDIKSIELGKSADELSLSIIINALNPLTQSEIGKESPRKYLNTFRFKLFCVSVKVALAICCTKFYGIEFPIVMDDIFDSSDFNNRERIRDFISYIYDCYTNLLNSTHPLQLIFFTQDDIVGDSVYRGIMDSEADDDAKYVRIFDFAEAEPEEWHPCTLNGSVIEVLTIEDQIKCAL